MTPASEQAPKDIEDFLRERLAQMSPGIMTNFILLAEVFDPETNLRQLWPIHSEEMTPWLWEGMLSYMADAMLSTEEEEDD